MRVRLLQRRVHRIYAAVVQEWVGRITVREKGPADLVTQADFASQETIRRILLDAFPEHSLLGEEDQLGAEAPPRAEYRWIADPLDTNTRRDSLRTSLQQH